MAHNYSLRFKKEASYKAYAKANPMSTEAVKDVIKSLGLTVDNTWYDGNKSRPVYDCPVTTEEFGKDGLHVCVLSEPPYECKVWIKEEEGHGKFYREDIVNEKQLRQAISDALEHVGAEPTFVAKASSETDSEEEEDVYYGDIHNEKTLLSVMDGEGYVLQESGVDGYEYAFYKEYIVGTSLESIRLYVLVNGDDAAVGLALNDHKLGVLASYPNRVVDRDTFCRFLRDPVAYAETDVEALARHI